MRVRAARAFLLGPGVNLYRAPMNGRNFEYFGEDPWLAAQITVGYVEGVQSQGVAATIKHYIGNNSEFARSTSDSIIDERTLREIYLPAFESGGEAGARRRGDERVQHHQRRLHEREHVSRPQGAQGRLGIRRPVHVRLGRDSRWRSRPPTRGSRSGNADRSLHESQTLEPAIRDGKLSRADIDDKVRRLLGLADRFGWMSRTEPDVSIPAIQPGRPRRRAPGRARGRGAAQERRATCCRSIARA